MNTLLEGRHGQFKENKADGVAEGYVCLTQFHAYSSGGGSGFGIMPFLWIWILKSQGIIKIIGFF